MKTATTAISVKRNTAMTLVETIAAPLAAMTDDTVPVGAKLYGFDPTDPANEAWTFDVNEDATREPNQHFADPFNMVAWAAKKIMLAADADREARPAVRLTLLDDQGERLTFCSGGVLESLDLIRCHRGDGPYSPPVPIVVTESQTRFGYRVYKLRIYKDRSKKSESK